MIGISKAKSELARMNTLNGRSEQGSVLFNILLFFAIAGVAGMLLIPRYERMARVSEVNKLQDFLVEKVEFVRLQSEVRNILDLEQATLNLGHGEVRLHYGFPENTEELEQALSSDEIRLSGDDFARVGERWVNLSAPAPPLCSVVYDGDESARNGAPVLKVNIKGC